MAVRSKGEPDAKQSFLQRILHALDMTPRDLARQLADGNRSEALRLNRQINMVLGLARYELTDMDRDVLWFEIETYVNRQLAYLLAVKHELNATLQVQRTQRAIRQARQDERPATSAPNSLSRRRV